MQAPDVIKLRPPAASRLPSLQGKQVRRGCKEGHIVHTWRAGATARRPVGSASSGPALPAAAARPLQGTHGTAACSESAAVAQCSPPCATSPSPSRSMDAATTTAAAYIRAFSTSPKMAFIPRAAVNETGVVCLR